MATIEVVGIVLAAGDGVRMGGSKALLTLGGEPLVRAHVARLREAGCKRVVAVVRGDVLGALGVVKDAAVYVSHAPDQAGSLAVALREQRLLPNDVVVITPVDASPAGLKTLETLTEEVRAGALAATPRFEGKSGHPVACRSLVLDPYRKAAPYPPLRDVLRGLGDGRHKIDVNDPRVTWDLDTPEDVLAATGVKPAFAAGAAGPGGETKEPRG